MTIDTDLIRIGLLSAIATWGVTQALKPVVKRWAADTLKSSAVRFFALAVGAGFGAAMQFDAVGAIVGLGGAALSATVVGAVKARIKNA
jgi:hypothetical protein